MKVRPTDIVVAVIGIILTGALALCAYRGGEQGRPPSSTVLPFEKP